MKPPDFDRWSGFTDEEFELVKTKNEDLTSEQVEVKQKATERVLSSLPPFTRPKLPRPRMTPRRQPN